MNLNYEVKGYIAFSKVYNYFNIDFHKLETLVKYYKLTFVKCKGMKYLKIEDFEFLKKLGNKIYENYAGKLSEDRFKNKLTLSHLAEKFNTCANNLKYIIKTNNINLNYVVENSVKIYDKDSIDILNEFFKKPKYTKKFIAEQLKINVKKLNRYLEYIEPNENEYNGIVYSEEFVNKLKEFVNKYPDIRQNKVYVNELNMQFDSKSEAYYYCYMKDHNHDITYHPLTLSFVDINNNHRIYEVDFLVDGKLIEIKGDNQFDKNGNPIYKGESWKDKYDCMIKNNVEIIKSKRLEGKGDLRFMKDYFYKFYSFRILNKVGNTYMISLQNCLENDFNLYKNIKSSEIHFAFEWKNILRHGVSKNDYYCVVNNSERNSYILSKIEELRSKGLDVSWFDKNKEKYLKTENEKETIFDL